VEAVIIPESTISQMRSAFVEDYPPRRFEERDDDEVLVDDVHPALFATPPAFHLHPAGEEEIVEDRRTSSGESGSKERQIKRAT